MDKEGTADISPSARFGVTEAIVTNKLYCGLVNLFAIERSLDPDAPPTKIVFKEEARKDFLTDGKVDFDKI